MQKALTQQEIKDWSIEEIDEKWPEIMLSSDYYKEGHASVKLTLYSDMISLGRLRLKRNVAL